MAQISSVIWSSQRLHDSASIVFVTPESAVTFTWDEGHTVSDGSPRFRPELRKLGKLALRGVQMVYQCQHYPLHGFPKPLSPKPEMSSSSASSTSSKSTFLTWYATLSAELVNLILLNMGQTIKFLLVSGWQRCRQTRSWSSFQHRARSLCIVVVLMVRTIWKRHWDVGFTTERSIPKTGMLGG